MNSLPRIFSLVMCKTLKYFIFTSPVTLAALAGRKEGGRGVFMEGRGAAEEHKSQRSIKNPRSCYLRNTIPKFFWKWAMPGRDTTRAGSRMNRAFTDHQWFLNFILSSTPETKWWASVTDTACRFYPHFGGVWGVPARSQPLSWC